jgi:hypothetical protein
MRNGILLSALLVAAGCATDTHISQTVAHIPQPEITIIGRTNLTDLPSPLASGVEAHYEFRIVNKAAVPITLRHIDLDSLGGGSIRIESKSRPFNIVIQAGSAQSADFVTTAYISNPNSPTSHSPVQLRATVLFDSPQGSLQMVAVQQVRPEGSD